MGRVDVVFQGISESLLILVAPERMRGCAVGSRRPTLPAPSEVARDHRTYRCRTMLEGTRPGAPSNRPVGWSPGRPDSCSTPSPRRAHGTPCEARSGRDRKSTRLNSSHSQISYAVFCLKKKKNQRMPRAPYCVRRSLIHVETAQPHALCGQLSVAWRKE